MNNQDTQTSTRKQERLVILIKIIEKYFLNIKNKNKSLKDFNPEISFLKSYLQRLQYFLHIVGLISLYLMILCLWLISVNDNFLLKDLLIKLSFVFILFAILSIFLFIANIFFTPKELLKTIFKNFKTIYGFEAKLSFNNTAKQISRIKIENINNKTKIHLKQDLIQNIVKAIKNEDLFKEDIDLIKRCFEKELKESLNRDKKLLPYLKLGITGLILILGFLIFDSFRDPVNSLIQIIQNIFKQNSIYTLLNLGFAGLFLSILELFYSSPSLYSKVYQEIVFILEEIQLKLEISKLELEEESNCSSSPQLGDLGGN